MFGYRTVQCSRVPKAVEVARPNATLELVIKTAMPKGTTIPKGRLTWPREPKPQSEERVLVFAEGRQAEEAKRAGAHTVGGLELIDDVSFLLNTPGSRLILPNFFPGYCRDSQSNHNPLCARSPSFDHPKTRTSARSKRSYAFREARDCDRRHCWLYAADGGFRGMEE